jgi:predicted phosphodiesterase
MGKARKRVAVPDVGGHPEAIEPAAPSVEESTEPVVRFPDLKKADFSFEEMLEHAHATSAYREGTEPSQTAATIDLSDWKEPIGIFLISDLHLGAPQCDYLTFLEHIRALKNTPNLFALIQGDMLEWSLSPRMLDSTLGQVLPPRHQARLMREIIREMILKTLAAVLGNHEGRAEKFAGFDVGEFIYDEFQRQGKGAYLKDGGVLSIKVGQQSYSWMVMHGDSRFGSMYNPNHKAMQLARMTFGYCDIVSTGHTHSAAVQQMEVPSQDGGVMRKVVALQAGSYKITAHEQYPWRLGFGKSPTVDMPLVILDPHTHSVIPFLRMEDGLRVLRSLTSGKTAPAVRNAPKMERQKRSSRSKKRS